MAEKKTSKKKATKEEVLGKHEFIDHLKGGRPTEVVEGCRIRGLSAADYQRWQTIRSNAALKGKGDDRTASMMEAETLAWLSLGIIEPQMDYEEWKHHGIMDEANAGKIQQIVAAIKRLSGITDLEAEWAKKLSAQILEEF